MAATAPARSTAVTSAAVAIPPAAMTGRATVWWTAATRPESWTNSRSSVLVTERLPNEHL
ncbi:hypothetical protein [Streptomyces sp. NPDC101455]|uniref:hypothetical protein n=1 Tax=Streptomyces sp. NPDC101455 TaxID=3366142 RepID=UPI00380E9790